MRPLLLLLACLATPSLAETAHDHAGHSHANSAEDKQIYKGYFNDAWVAQRALSDWEGSWQSVYPYLRDGTLDAVMAHKAESGEKTAAEHRAYYETGYQTDVDRIEIKGETVQFTSPKGTVSGRYAADGYEVLTYKKGNRGVRFIYRKVEGDAGAPSVIQFSDHIIAPQKSGHYHLYWGEDRAELLKEMEHWPTYYPAALNGAQIVEEMLAH